MSEDEAKLPAPQAPPPLPSQGGLGLPAVAALALPVVTGCMLVVITWPGWAFAIAGVNVVGSSLLMAKDAVNLGRTDRKGRKRESAGLLFVGMVLLWIVVYPLVFFRRRHFAGPNLGILAVLAALFFVGAPFLQPVLLPLIARPHLPACDS